MKQNIYAIRCTIAKNIKKEKKRLNAFLQTQRKSMECATPNIEAWKKPGAYDACFCRNESAKISHLAVGAYVFIPVVLVNFFLEENV